jgi:hypothetical protein
LFASFLLITHCFHLQEKTCFLLGFFAARVQRQAMPADAVSKSVASQPSPELKASQRQLSMNGKSYVISEIPRQ